MPSVFIPTPGHLHSLYVPSPGNLPEAEWGVWALLDVYTTVKTIMAPLRTVLALGIIILLMSQLSESSPSPDEQTVNKVSTQNREIKDENTAQEDEPVASKLKSFKAIKCHLTFV